MGPGFDSLVVCRSQALAQALMRSALLHVMPAPSSVCAALEQAVLLPGWSPPTCAAATSP